MLVNGYEVGREPSDEEFATYIRVKNFLRREFVAQWAPEGQLTPEEFDTLEYRLGTADFSAEEWEFLEFEYDELKGERE